MNYFFFRLTPPRPTFSVDMTPAECALMQRHVEYWMELMQRGQAVAFGPVADPRGAFGIGIVRLAESADPQTITNNDPCILAGIGFRSEFYPMPQLMLPQQCGMNQDSTP